LRALNIEIRFHRLGGYNNTLCSPSDLELDHCTLLMEVLPQRCIQLTSLPSPSRTDCIGRSNFTLSVATLFIKCQCTPDTSSVNNERVLLFLRQDFGVGVHACTIDTEVYRLAHYDFSGRRHFHRNVVRHGGRNPLLGAPAVSQPASLPCAIISLLQLVQVD
jgi:hypothetical protein